MNANNPPEPPDPDELGPPPAPRHGLPVPARAAAAMDVPPGVHPADLALIEALRREVRALDFTPLTDAQVARQVAHWPSAAASQAIEGNPLSPADHALARMLLAERVPPGTRPQLVARFARECRLDPPPADPTPPAARPVDRPGLGD